MYSSSFGQQSHPAQHATTTVDWSGLEQKFNELKSYLSEPSLSFSNSTAQRSKQRENVELGLEAIIEVALSESHMLLRDGDYRAAIQGGLKTLHFVQDLYGMESSEQIEPYFLLAKANQYMKRFKKAEEFLSIAHWTVIKNPECPAHIRAELHQNFGLLNVSKGDIDAAIEHLSKSTYYLALLHGTEHLITSFGYFNLGNVFASQDKMDCATDFLKLVIEIWNRHLLEVLESDVGESSGGASDQTDAQQQSGGILALDKLDEDKIQEAGRMFEQILSIQMRRYGDNHMETGKIFLVFGLYEWYVGEINKSREYLNKSLQIMQYVLGNNHQQTKQVERIIEQTSDK